MRVVFSLHRYAPAGAGSEVYARGVCEWLVRAGHEVSVVCTDRLADHRRYRPLAEVRDGVFVRRVTRRDWRSVVGRWRGVEPVALAEPIARAYVGEIRKRRPDVVVALPVPRQSVVAGLAGARASGARAIVVPMFHYAQTAFVQDRAAWLSLLASFDGAITLSNAERDFLVDHGLHDSRVASPGMWVAEPPAIDDAAIRRWRESHELTDRFVVLTAAAEFSAAKGMETLARVAAALPDVTFAFIGGTRKSRAWLEGTVTSENVRMLGFVDAREKATAFRAADLFAMPSAAESFGIVYIEAHYAGTPVLAAELDAVREVVGGGGVFVPFGDVAATRDTIAQLRDDTARRAALTAAGEANANRFRPEQALRRIGEAIVAIADQDPVGGE